MLRRELALLAVVLAGCVPHNEHTVHRMGAVSVHTLRLEFANAHLVQQGDTAFLVDTGGTVDAPRLLSEIREAGVEPPELRAVIVTHGHADHAGGAATLQRLGVPVVAGRGDETPLTRGWNEPLCPTSDAARERLDEAQVAEFDPVEADHWVSDTALDLAPLVGIEGRIIPLPGHTPGSLVVVLGNLALVGDLVRGEVLGDGADVHFYMCDLDDNRADLEALLDTHAPDATRFFVGHFGPLTRPHIRDLLREDW